LDGAMRLETRGCIWRRCSAREKEMEKGKRGRGRDDVAANVWGWLDSDSSAGRR
jgi:hypothetical protein